MDVSYQVFARKYRPQTFDDVLGQDHVVQTLKNAIEQKRLAHAYLFVGPRGTGKTSTARIFAKALNCPNGPSIHFDPNASICQEIAEGRSLDVLEIDGASNNGVEQVRDLRDNVQFMPTSGQYRIFYIDEVHMLSKPAFNALLKTLEEPPAHVKFIFATTEAHKILPTILSRCQRFDLRPISTDVIARHLLHIASQEGVNLSEKAAFAVAKVADGGMRDAQSMLDQLVSFCGNTIEESHVLDIFGIASRETICQTIGYMLGRQISQVLQIIHDQSEAGRDLTQFLAETIFGLREVLISKVDSTASIEGISQELRTYLLSCTTTLDTAKLLRLIEILAETQERMKWATNKRLHLEIGLIKAVHSLSEANISDIIRALDGAPLTESAPASALTPSPEFFVQQPPTVQAQPAPAISTAPVLKQETDEEQSVPLEIFEQQKPEEESEAQKTTTQPIPVHAEEASVPVTNQNPAPETIVNTDIPPTPEHFDPEPTIYQAPPHRSLLVAEDTAFSLFDNLYDQAEPQETPHHVEQTVKRESSPETPPTPSCTDDNSDEEETEDAMPRGFIDQNTAPLFDDLEEQALKEETSTNGSQLWKETLLFLSTATPLKYVSIEHIAFLHLHNHTLTVGVHPNDLMARDILIAQDMKGKIEQFLSEKSGTSLRFSLETTDLAAMPEEIELEPLIFTPPPSKPREPAPPEPKQEESTSSSPETETDFYNDPLIEEALHIFHAKIVS